MKKTNQFWNELSLDCTILNNISLPSYLSKFWKTVMILLENHQVVYILLKVRFDDDSYATFSKLQQVNKTMFDDLLEVLQGFLDSKAENYSNKVITNVIFQYHICYNKNIRTNLSKSDKVKKVPLFNFVGYNLPITTDLKLWGVLSNKTDNIYSIIKKGSNLNYSVHREDQIQTVKVSTIKGKLLFEFKDIFGINPSSFTRILKNQEFIFLNGVLKLKKLIRKTEFISKIKVDKKISNRFLTLDIETRTINNIMEPYCVSIFNGTKFTSFYLTDYADSDTMLRNVIQSLMKTRYNRSKIYIHNLSNFDGVFLFKVLSNFENTHFKPVMKDNKMISLQFTWKNNPDSSKFYSIEFRDSLLLLPNSLRKLSKAFKVEDKGIFPYDFVNLADLNYIGPVPAFNYFTDISMEEYNIYKTNFNDNWDLREETIKYCFQDCISLYQVLTTFNSLIFDMYQLNISNFPTLPSLAFGIYRCKYLQEIKIPLISGEMFDDIRKGYTGGHTDVYKPFGKNIYRYDVNSLYPFVMSKFPMPVGNITYFEGDILKLDNKAFGFFEVEVSAPDNLNRPLLQTKVKTSGGLRTVAALGKWKDMVFSEEMNKYLEYGYSFKVIRGYLFEQGFIFNDYVNDLYKIKQAESKDSPMYLISKLLMNSLYGRFGMTPYLIEHSIIENSLLDKFINKKEFDILECIDLNNGKSLISFQAADDNEAMQSSPNVSISIAAAITAQARIHMSKFLGNLDLKIYYTDTDSIDIAQELNSKYIGKGLGKMKLEYIFDEATFLAPKVYGGITETGELTKVKGFKNEVSYSDLKSLLIKDSKLELNQDKW